LIIHQEAVNIKEWKHEKEIGKNTGNNAGIKNGEKKDKNKALNIKKWER